MTRPVAIELFAGTGMVSAMLEDVGYRTIRVEKNERFDAEARDVLTFEYDGPRPTVVWASPPCLEFSRRDQPWSRARFVGIPPDLTLVDRTRVLIEEWDPTFFVVENVRGARPWFEPIWGKPRVYGSYHLYGRFPDLVVDAASLRNKSGASGGSLRSIRRATIPLILARAFADAVAPASL